MSAFKDYFLRRNGQPWPAIGQLQPSGTTWEEVIMETMADYMDEMERRIAMFDDPTRRED